MDLVGLAPAMYILIDAALDTEYVKEEIDPQQDPRRGPEPRCPASQRVRERSSPYLTDLVTNTLRFVNMIIDIPDPVNINMSSR